MVKRQQISDEVWNDNYRAPGESSLEDTWERQARACAQVESPENREKAYKDFLWLLTDFRGIAGGRITANLGVPERDATTLFNCYVFQPGDVGYKDPDSIEGIYDMLKAQALTLKSEGGYGMNFSWIRPAGAYVKGIAGRTPGVLKFMELWDKSSEVITMGSEKVLTKKDDEKKKIRKGAQMACLSCHHPEIEDFIVAKQTPGRLTKFNMSVGITPGFMEAVEADGDWDLIFPDTTHPEYKTIWGGDIEDWKARGLPIVVHKTIKARDLWDKIMKSTYNRNEPGVLFLDVVNKRNPLYYAENVMTTNPCFHGDTLIAVADGRNAVPIRQLAEDGLDVAVYSINPSGKVEIKWGRHPRVTGENQKLARVHLDDGSFLDVTLNHKFWVLDGDAISKKETVDLVPGDSLPRFRKTKEPVKKNGKLYYSVCGNVLDASLNRTFEHRAIAKFYHNEEWDGLYNSLHNNGFVKTGGLVVHHKDYNQLNNAPKNLQIMSFQDHSKLHNEIDKAGEKNGRFLGISNAELFNKGIELTKRLGRKFSVKDWLEFADENSLPKRFSRFRSKELGTISSLSRKCAMECGFQYTDADPRAQKKCSELLSLGYDAYIRDDQTYVRRICEVCSCSFEVASPRRENCICLDCGAAQINSAKFYDNKSKQNKTRQAATYSSLKFKLGRKPQRKEWERACRGSGVPFRLNSQRSFKCWDDVIEAGENYNHKVVQVEYLDGLHTVYNITVDDNHTVGIVSSINKTNKIALDGLFTANCGEIAMSCGVCLLFSLNLTKYIKKTDKFEFDFDEFRKASEISVRFADNINDISRVPIDDYRKSMQEKRRVGIGVVGLGSLLAVLGIRYGSKEGVELTEKIFKTKAETEILASAKLGKEKGSFPLFDKDKYFSSYWWKTLPISDTVKNQVEKIGCMRNSHRSANAPTGNMSIYAGVLSGGIEPIFMLEYARWGIVTEGVRAELRTAGFQFPDVFKGEFFETEHLKKAKAGNEEVLLGEFNGVQYQVDRNRGLTKKSIVEDWSWSFIKENLSKEEIQDRISRGILGTTSELSHKEHVDMLKCIAQYVDMASSKTINIPNDYPYEDFKDIYMDAWKAGIKGLTTYRAGTMTAVLESAEDSKEAKRTAPKRPKELTCNIHTAKVNGHKWVVIIGLLNNEPYEIFAGPAENIDVKNGQIGSIIKRKRGEYCLQIDGEILTVEKKDEDGKLVSTSNIVNILDDPSSAWATRLVSMSLRHGVPIDFTCEQLNKDGFITDINKVLARILKKYSPSERKVEKVCPSCGSKNIKLDEGCLICMDCSFGKCG